MMEHETHSEPEQQTLVQPSEEQKPAGKSRLRVFLSDVLDIVESVVTSVFVVLLFFAFVLRPVTVDGTSMLPTLMNEDRVLMTEWFYTPKQGDIVIIDGCNAHVLDENNEVVERRGIGINLVKRVIALSGQTLDIDFTRGVVTVDGVVQQEDYINALTTSNDGAFTYPLTVPEGYVFVMGDNRNGSTDSRSALVGLINKDDILGHALCRFYREEKNRDSWSDQFAGL